ncbi:MAG: hypothetical protein IJ301_02310 [Clostridia bacterium]|nr:hypothetical protein [Clostridia bacterium]
MTKKAVVAIEVVVCLLAVVIISIFGINPEAWRDDIPAQSLVITNQSDPVREIDVTRSTDTNGREVVNVKLPSSIREYQIEWEISPENVTVTQISFTSAQIGGNIISISDTGLVNFLTNSNEGATIMLKTTDGTNRIAQMIITFKASSSGGDIEL